MTERLLVTRMGRRGDGIAEAPGGPVFIPATLPGETVTVEPEPGHPDRRRLVRVETASPERVSPICPHFGSCGGCAVQHWQEAPYRAWKRALVVDALRFEGIDAPVETLVDAHGAGRRRAVFHARQGAHAVLAVGFAARRAHRIIPIDHCPILAPPLGGAIEAAWAIAEALSPLRKPLDIQVTATNEGLDIDLRGSGPLPASAAGALARIATDRKLARITRHGELIVQCAPPTVTIGRARVALPPAAFLQATQAGEEVLAALVVQAAGDADPVADLFAGIGPFALRLAERARILAADSSAAALTALRQAAATAPGLKPIETASRDLFRRPLLAPELNGYQAIVFDPPRQGALAQARELAASRVPRIIAVSCNPTSFARDAAILLAGGYHLTRVTPLDQFRYSPHVEIVGQFSR